MNAAERGNAIEQDRDAGETARKQVGGLNECLDQKCLENGGNCDRHCSNGAADDGETAEHEHAVRELIDGVRHVGSFRRQMWLWGMPAIVAWSVRGRFNSPSLDNQSGTNNPHDQRPKLQVSRLFTICQAHPKQTPL